MRQLFLVLLFDLVVHFTSAGIKIPISIPLSNKVTHFNLIIFIQVSSTLSYPVCIQPQMNQRQRHRIIIRRRKIRRPSHCPTTKSGTPTVPVSICPQRTAVNFALVNNQQPNIKLTVFSKRNVIKCF
jgi:hypothetical protein